MQRALAAAAVGMVVLSACSTPAATERAAAEPMADIEQQTTISLYRSPT